MAQPWQVLVVVLHTGVVPLQFASVRHPTHTPPLTSHTGVAPVQAVLFVAEHWPQAPDG